MHDKIQLVSLLFALFGVFLVWFFSPDMKYSEFQDCSGLVTFSGKITKTFFSSSGNYIGIIEGNSHVMTVLNESFRKGDLVKIYGRASVLSGQCWVFPDSVAKNA